MAVSAKDTPVEVDISLDGAIGDKGADGVDGSGFSQVRAHIVNNPLSRVLKRNQFVSVLNGNVVFERNSSATYFDIYGDLITATNDVTRPTVNGWRFDGEATNYFLNSDAPVTQSINLTAGDYVLSITGTGSVSSIDGTATEGSPLTFNNSGNINFVVAGTVNTVQLESGSNVTSYIPTLGSAVTRQPDELAANLGGNLPNVENPFSVLFGVSTSSIDYCVYDSAPLRVSNDASGSWSVNGVASTVTGAGTILITYDGVDTKIYKDGVLGDTIAVSYTKSSSGDSRYAARLDGTRPLIGDLLDLRFYETNLNDDEASFLKG